MEETETKTIMQELADLCQEIYEKSYHDVFDFGEYSDEELQEQKAMLLRKKELLANLHLETIVEQKEIPEPNGEDFFTLWNRLWDMRIESQPVLREIYSVVALSQIFKKVKIYRGSVEEDIRVHSCVIMPSGTGKSEGNDFLYQFAMRNGKKYYSIERFTDAILTGSIKRGILDRNTSKGLKEGDIGWKDPTTPSVLTTYDYVVSDEGESILKSSRQTEGAQRLLQKAMNRYGSEGNLLTNNLVDGEITARPDCSIAITSYYLDEFKDTLLERGLLQRMIVYIQEENEDRRTKIIDRIIDDIASFTDNKDEAYAEIFERKDLVDGYYAHLVAEVNRLKKIHQDTEYVVMMDESKPILRNSIDELRNIMPMLVGQKQIWESMISRLTVNILKISAIYALADGRDYIMAKDTTKASSLMMETMRSVAFFLKDNVQTKMDNRTVQVHARLKAKKGGYFLSEKEWVEYLVKEMGFSEQQGKILIKNFIDNGKMSYRADKKLVLS